MRVEIPHSHRPGKWYHHNSVKMAGWPPMMLPGKIAGCVLLGASWEQEKQPGFCYKPWFWEMSLSETWSHCQIDSTSPFLMCSSVPSDWNISITNVFKCAQWLEESSGKQDWSTFTVVLSMPSGEGKAWVLLVENPQLLCKRWNVKSTELPTTV